MNSSSVRPFDKCLESKLYLDPSTTRNVIKSRIDENNDDTTHAKNSSIRQDGNNYRCILHIIDPSDLVGISFLLQKSEDKKRLRVKIIDDLSKNQEDLGKNLSHLEFLRTIIDYTIEEFMS